MLFFEAQALVFAQELEKFAMHDYLKKFRGRRVFITGHTGFKGSWLTYLLTRLGARVTGFSLPQPDGERNFSLLRLQEKVHHVVGDIRDPAALEASLIDSKAEFVFHLAAQALVSESYRDPVETISTNVLGSANLLEAVRKSPSVRSLVYVTSDKAYENKEWPWGYRENDELGGRDPYSASKGAAELIFSAFNRSFFSERTSLGVASVRAGNVIGGGDFSENRLVPDCIRAIRSQSAIVIRNPNSTRPWQHVLEPLSGYLKLAAQLDEDPDRYSGSWNFGPPVGAGASVKEVATKIAKVFGDLPLEVSTSEPASYQPEAKLLQLNCDKANLLLGWFPSWGLEDTIRHTADWYFRVTMGEDPSKVTLQQAKLYFGEGYFD
jgi:CDP-glucose 4,6-dehydratase